MKVYLSGPMSGIEDFNFPAFEKEAKRLRAANIEVVSPHEVNPDTTMTWEQCLRADIKALCDCDTLVLMDGWESSKGANLELHIAHRLGMTVVQARDL
jgi:nucleoside 2-deoxyribosyltransferase